MAVAAARVATKTDIVGEGDQEIKDQEVPKQELERPIIDRILQREIYVGLCTNIDPQDLSKPGTTNDQVKVLFRHLRGLSEIAAHEFGSGVFKS
jgi:hypothetical protein